MIPLTPLAKKQIEMVKLLQKLKKSDEKPGAIVLRALRALEAEAKKKGRK